MFFDSSHGIFIKEATIPPKRKPGDFGPDLSPKKHGDVVRPGGNKALSK